MKTVAFQEMMLFILFALAAVSSAVRYNGYQALRLEPHDDSQLNFLRTLESDLDGRISFWTSPSNIVRPTDILVPPRFQNDVKELLDSKGIKYSVMIEDVQTLIDSQARSVDDVKINTGFDYSIYHTYDEIQDWVFEIASTYSTMVEQFQIGTSFQDRAINALKISTGGDGTKKAIYWQGGIHAREWISPATVMYITKSLLESYGVDPDVTEILDTFDICIVPSLNVDGYAYTWALDRLWRKTRSVYLGNGCRGVDPNRNYDYKWGGEGAQTNPCTETYRGPNALSEREIIDTTTFLLNSKQEFVSFIDFHSYSQLWLAPWSFTARTLLPADKEDHFEAGAKAITALEAVYGTDYLYGPSALTLYAASGCSVDWGYATLGAKYSYVVELRDLGSYGFLLPPEQIIPTGEETLEGVKALCRHMVMEYK